jgi:hypothetical protein
MPLTPAQREEIHRARRNLLRAGSGSLSRIDYVRHRDGAITQISDFHCDEDGNHHRLRSRTHRRRTFEDRAEAEKDWSTDFGLNLNEEPPYQ